MIYFVQIADQPAAPIKIGCTGGSAGIKGAEWRLKQLQCGCPWLLRILAVMDGDEKVEKQLHTFFRRVRFRSEWFNPSKELLALIDLLNALEAAKDFNPLAWMGREIQKRAIEAGASTKLLPPVSNSL